MNKLHNRKLVISFVTWEPFDKHILNEINELVTKIKSKELLAHAGYVHLQDIEEPN